MKNISPIIIVLMLLVFTNCKTSSVKKHDSSIAVSILPQKYFIDRITNNDFKVTVLIPPGASPATYEPNPLQMQSVARAVAYFRIGKIPFEEIWLNNLLKNTKDISVVDLSQGIKFIVGEERHGDHIHQGGIDPHIWSSPILAKDIAKNTFNALVRLKPANKKRYQQNLNQLLSDIDCLIATCKKLTSKKKKAFFIYHPALTYLAKDCGMQQIAIEKDGKAPSPAHLHQLINIAKANHIKTIFIQKQFNKENAKTLANEIGAKLFEIDPLCEDWLHEMQRMIKQLAMYN